MAQRLELFAPDRIDHHVRRPSGVYVPDSTFLADMLARSKVAPDRQVKYVPQGDEIRSLEVARDCGHSVLLVGPTGVGKSLLMKMMAQKWDLPFLYFSCDPDKTEGRLMGREQPMFITAVDETGKGSLISIQQLRPSNISLAALANTPVVLFIDELHKLRKDADALFYYLTNDRTVDLTDHLGPGEYYPLHPKTLVGFALNPDYGDGGIQKVGQAMRQRVVTLYFKMITDPNRLLEIVVQNVGDLKSHKAVMEKICQLCATIVRVYQSYKHGLAEDTHDDDIRSQLHTALPQINEAPSPRLLVNVARAIMAGQKPATALEECVFHAIVDEFLQTPQALKTAAKLKYGIE